MTANDRATTTVKALEEYVYRDCIENGRFDVLDAIRTGGYELRDEGGNVVSFWVGTERVLRVRLNLGLPKELLN